MPTYRPPQLTIQQEFSSLPLAFAESLQTCVVGPNKRVFEYTDSEDRELINFGAYDPDNGNTESFVSLPAINVVDQSSIRLFVEDLYAKYATLTGANIIERGTAANVIKLGADSAGSFIASTGFSRSSTFNNRDVKVGDKLRITSAAGVVLDTRVTGSVANVVAASATSFSNGAANPATQVYSGTPAAVDEKETDHVATISVANTTYLGWLSKGVVSDVYTLECTTAGTAAAALFRVTSTQGDNVTSVSVGAFDTPFNIGTRGLQGSIASAGTESFILGEKYTFTVASKYTRHVPQIISAASYVGKNDTTYTVKVIKGGLFASESPQVVVSTNNGVDYAGAKVVADNTAFALGTLGLTMKFPLAAADQDGLLLNDTYTVTVTAASKGAIRTLVLADPINTVVVDGDDLTVDFYIYKASFEVPIKGYPEFGSEALTSDEDGFAVSAGLTITDSSWTEVDGVTLIQVPVERGTIFVSYSTLLTEGSNVFNTISDLSSVSAVLGKVVPENPLAYGVNVALLNSNGVPIHYVAISSDDTEGYADALIVLESNELAYFNVPCTETLEVQQLFKAHVLAMSAKDREMERIAFTSAKLEEVVTKYGQKEDDSFWTGYVAVEPGGTEYNRLTIPDASFTVDGIRAGDYVRANYTVDAFGAEVFDSVKVASVTDEQNLILASPGFAALVGTLIAPERISIVRVLARTEQAEAIASTSSSFDSRRVYNVWPDSLVDAAGREVAGHFGAIAVAALKSSVAPHQPITNYTINGFSSVPRAFGYFTPTQLNAIAAGGTLILTQDSKNGPIYIRHQISTDMSDVNHSELSITTNLDSITKFIRVGLHNLIGKYNRTEYFLQITKSMLFSKLFYLQTSTSTPTAGAQIGTVEATDLSILADPVLRTLTNVRIKLRLPYPNNYLDIVLEVI